MDCAVSVDLDEIHHYLSIHGAGELSVDAHVVYDVAVPRLLGWAEQRNISLTLFAVGADLTRVANRRVLLDAVARGHEIGNHSYSHAYDLTRQTPALIEADIERANSVIEAATGFTPRGFRAPGYTITDTVYAVLDRQGFAYSSSVFPCPIYYGAKACAIGAKRLLGRKSSSVLDDLRVLSAPAEPYRVGRPYWHRGVGLLELPIQTTPGLRLPYIGTSVMGFGTLFARFLTSQLLELPFVNLELHGVDFLSADDGLAELAVHQFDLRIPLAKKLEALDAALDRLQRAGYCFRTLSDVALAFDLERHRGQNPAS
jgi:peptidoglycan-N-acetylglucosamine deacetylase